MKYSDIITLPEYFESYYDLTAEHENYWMRFIPNERFNEILSITIRSLGASQAAEKKSIFMQGTFGTGKTHAAAVIKHLLWDELSVIDKYPGDIGTQLKERIRNFRKLKKVFPVVLKGISNITDNRTFSLAIEKAVKDALNANDVEIQTESDFEKMIVQVKENPLHIDWNQLITNTNEIRMYVNTTADLIKKLENKDITMLKILETIINQKGGHFTYSEIDKWLVEVSNELKAKNIADCLMIFWDEFTPVMQHHNRNELLNQLQGIAELSKNHNVLLFVISHKTAHQSGLSDEEAKKTFDRFYVKDYAMEPITTYHLIAAAINKKDEIKYIEIKNKFFDASPQLNTLIEQLSLNQGASVKNDIRNLFPIHPYTAYLATFIARNIGSADRSIFKFLDDDQRGFRSFLNQEVGNDVPVITADYLWDYFFEEFDRDNSEKFLSALSKFYLHAKEIERTDKNYNAIFKGILLLNLLYKMVSAGETAQSLVAPSMDNIKSLFLGSHLGKYVDEAVDFIDRKKIIRRTPDNLFLVSSSTLPQREINEEKQKLVSSYEDITKVLDFDSNSKSNLTSVITIGMLRVAEVNFYWAGEKEHILKTRLLKDFKKTYSLHLAVFLSKDDLTISSIKSAIKQMSQEEEFKHIIFILIDKPLGEDKFDRLITFAAESAVARNHNFTNDAITNEGFAKKIVEDWINNIKNGYATIVINGDEERQLANSIGSFISGRLSSRVFKYGLENLQETRRNYNVWKSTNSPTAIEKFLFANSRDDIETNTTAQPWSVLRNILKNNKGDYVIKETLEIKQPADTEHPLVKISREVEDGINNCQNHPNFNLGDRLRFLTEPPYGIYPNMVNMALIGVVLRKYIGRLYEAGSGRLIEKDMMRDKIVTLFKYWQDGNYSNRLDVRFGTLEEKELVEKLKGIFNLNDATGLNDVRWGIRDFVKRMKFPLWSIKYLPANDGLKKAIDEIFMLTKTPDSEIGYEDVKRVLDAIKNNELDLELNLKEEKIKQGFDVFLKDIESVNITKAEIDEVVQYLYQNMQEEIASWEDEKVESKVKDWWISKISKPIFPSSSTPPSESTKGISPVDDSHKQKLKEDVKAKVKAYPGDLKALIIRVLDENAWLADTFNKYL